MIDQKTSFESPTNSEQTGGLAGSYSHVFLAVVDDIRREMPRYGPPSATAKVMIFDGTGGQTCVEIPVLSIVNQLDHVSRYLVEIKFRPMAHGEHFDPADSELYEPETTNNP